MRESEVDWLFTPGIRAVERPGEQEVMRRWEREIGLEFRSRAEHAGAAVARISYGPVTGPQHE